MLEGPFQETLGPERAMVVREVVQQVGLAGQPTTLFTNLDKLAVEEEMRVSQLL